MTISVWRYSHLTLAVSSFIFIALAAITGIVLAVEPINNKLPAYKADGFNQITLAQALPAINKLYTNITEISVDANQFVIVKGTDSAGKNVEVYVHPITGAALCKVSKQSNFFQWVTALHRSLFLHEAGRFFVGLTSLLLLLIALSGSILVIKRQRGFKYFFAKIIKDHSAQYFHVLLGRWSLVPIIIISLSGVYLSLVKFGVFAAQKITHKIDFNKLDNGAKKSLKDFAIFNSTPLADVQTIEYPFSDDPEDYYTLKLKDKELVVDQFSGNILSNSAYPTTALINNLSLDVHTGRKCILWAIVLGIASINILYFIYSGFVITLKRRSGIVKNKFNANNSQYIILVGSENGSTFGFANAIYQQLVASGKKVFITELNNYQPFAQAEHLLVLTATYGLGEAPTNASKFATLLYKYHQKQNIQFAVLGFGSRVYPEYCKYAYDAHALLAAQAWAAPMLEVHLVNDKSPDQFKIWLDAWTEKAGLPAIDLPAYLHLQPKGLQSFKVVSKTTSSHADEPFLITLKPIGKATFTSGDLLAIYPAKDYRERLYSIGKIGKHIQLSVKQLPNGLGSKFLYQLSNNNTLEARVISNTHFHVPSAATTVVMIANGTGIAPFLGMIDAHTKHNAYHLYFGCRTQQTYAMYKTAINAAIDSKQLAQIQVAYSREGKQQYVTNLLAADADFIANTLDSKGVLMLCGSLAMQQSVIEILATICAAHTNHALQYYQAQGQILTDCY
ncbi:MAG: PepSY domain-containing protein [Flavobacterium sp.]|nr:PepSY domain-containing protein [Flavobacterium sp.]